MVVKKRVLNLFLIFTFLVGFMFTLVYAAGPSITVGTYPSNISNTSFQGGSVTFNITTNINSNLTINITNSTGSVKGQIFSNLNTTHLKTWATNNGSYSDGVYNITIIAINSTNASEINNFINAIVNLTVDNTYPGNANVSTSVESSSVSINWHTSELTNDSINYGPSTSLGTIRYSSDFTSSKNTGFSDLTPSTLYYFNLTSCDRTFNCNTTGPYNFTTDSEVVESSSSSSSGSGPSYNLVESLDLGDSAEETMTGVGSIVKLDLPGILGKHTLELKSVDNNQVTFILSSEPTVITLEKGEENKVDLNNDGTYDLALKLIEISYISASRYDVNIRYTVINEQIQESGQEEATPNQEISSPKLSPETNKSNNGVAWIIGVILVLIIAGIIIKKKFSENVNFS